MLVSSRNGELTLSVLVKSGKLMYSITYKGGVIL